MVAQKDMEDQESKKRIIADTIASYCTAASPHPPLRKIGHAIREGDKLEMDILSGGVTNYSYKVYLSDSPETALFAKLSFPYALWNPDRDAFYDVKRTVNEFKMMELFGSMAPGCVPTAYLCVGVGDMMLLVTEWCTADEQFVNQFIDGAVDFRIAPRLARVIAKLHCYENFDPDFNTNVRPCMLAAFPSIEAKLGDLLNSADTECRAAVLTREMGRDLCYKIYEKLRANYINDRGCLVHSDPHVFNIIVEKKPSVENLSGFGQHGSFSLCDWEMAFAGPIGRDIGVFNAFPIVCAIAHAMNGHADASKNILEFLDLLWDEYATALDKGNKSKDFIRNANRNVVGWCGWYQFLAFYTLNVHLHLFPVDMENKDVRAEFLDSVGMLALKLLRLGFGDEESHLSLSGFRSKCNDAVEEEISFAVNKAKSKAPKERRASSLRASGRRLSDAPLHFHGARSFEGELSDAPLYFRRRTLS